MRVYERSFEYRERGTTVVLHGVVHVGAKRAVESTERPHQGTRERINNKRNTIEFNHSRTRTISNV
jgi:hypothetical protein